MVNFFRKREIALLFHTRLRNKSGRLQDMPLPIAPAGEELTVKKVLLDEKNKRHFENLGITIGSKITVVSQVGGNVILKVRDGRLALDKTQAMKILV